MNYTEAAITDAFLQLLDEKPFNKITVRDIVDRCGINRNTFYYHFQDIPSLLEKILTDRIDLLIQKHCHLGSLKDCISVTVQYFKENRRAVLHVYRSLPRETFVQHLDHLLLYLAREYIANVSSSLNLAAEDQDLLAWYFKCVLVGIFLDWLDSGMNYDLLDDSLRVCRLRDNTKLNQLLISCESCNSTSPESYKKEPSC